MMKKKWFAPVIVAVIVMVAAAAYFVNGTDDTADESAAPEFQAAERRTLEVTAEAAGQLEPIRLVEVKSKASGEILRLLVESGDQVKRGDLLGQVDPRDVRNALAQAEADLEVAKARMTTAQAQKKRSQELRQANVITEQEYESATLEEANARAQFVKAQVNLELARERMGDVTIRAPIDGVVIQKSVEEGQIIQSASQNISGGTTILMMADLSDMQVRTLVDETDLGKIQPGQMARVSVEAFPGRTFSGTVLKIEPQAVVEQNVTMFPVLVRLENRDGALKPGMNAEVVIEVARRENIVVVPNAAVVSMRDAVAAGALFGLSEEQMRAAMRASRGGSAADQGGASADRPTDERSAAGAAANGATRNAATGNQRAPDGAGTPRGEAGGVRPGGTDGARTPAAAGAEFRPGGGGNRPGRSGRGGGIGNGDTRMGVVFVRSATGTPEPRVVLLGLNDWDSTEVIRGVEPGEEVVLISVARLQQQQQEMLNRFRQNSGPFPGGGPGAGPGRR